MKNFDITPRLDVHLWKNIRNALMCLFVFRATTSLLEFFFKYDYYHFTDFVLTRWIQSLPYSLCDIHIFSQAHKFFMRFRVIIQHIRTLVPGNFLLLCCVALFNQKNMKKVQRISSCRWKWLKLLSSKKTKVFFSFTCKVASWWWMVMFSMKTGEKRNKII